MPEGEMTLNATALNQMAEDIENLKWKEKERSIDEKTQADYDSGYTAGKKACRKKLCKKKKICFKPECMPNFVLWMMVGAIAGSFLCTLIFFAFLK